jgi:N-acetylglucosamine-6-sulfatase
LLTGRYAHNHGIIDNTNRSEQSLKLVTFPRILHDNGYETGYIGKWHMGNDDTARPGFSYWACMAGQGTSFDPVLNENGTRIKSQGHTTDVLNDRAVLFVRRQRTEPFCLYLAHKALHPELVQYDGGSVSDPSGSKFLPALRHKVLYADASIPRRLNVTDTLNGKPALRRPVERLPPLTRETGTGDEMIRDRLRMLAAVDEGVEQLFAALEDTDQLHNTLIVFTSDHGYWNGEHGLSVERRLAYDEAIRIPLLVRFPARVESGTIMDDLALSIDFARRSRRENGACAGRPQPRSVVGWPAAGKVAHIFSCRILFGYRVSAHPQHGLQSRSYPETQIHPLHRSRRDGRNVRPAQRSL